MESTDKKDLILEGNKLLAVYLGYEYIPHRDGVQQLNKGWWAIDRPVLVMSKLHYKYFLGRTHKDLRFYNDWNLLMRVWKKYVNSGIEIQDVEYNLYDSTENAERNLLEGNREEFFNNLVQVVSYLNEKKVS